MRRAIVDAIDVPDQINWNTAVDEYSKYLIERTELIQEVDEDVLDFAHKTFYEYFLAVYYVKELSLEELINLLKKWIGDSNFDELARLIIEVIIQANSASQHQKIIDFLFTTIEQREIFSRESPEFSAFLILADLYSHNMLLPKFHSRYFVYILYHPWIIRLVENMHRYKGLQISQISYDSNIVSNLYCDVASDPDQIINVLDSVHYLDNDFRKMIIDKLPQKNHVQIVRLLRTSPLQHGGHTSHLSLIDYFTKTKDGLWSALHYPQVYVSLINLMVQEQYINGTENLVNVQFPSNEYIWEYTHPSAMALLIDQSVDSSASLMITLICLIDCAYHSTNNMFYFIINQDTHFLDRSERTISLALWLLYLLNETSSYNQFKTILQAKELFENKYEDKLKHLYNDYVTREKRLDRERIQKILDSNPSYKSRTPIEGLDYEQLSLSL